LRIPVNINIIAPRAYIKLLPPPLADTLKQFQRANFGDLARNEGGQG